MIYGDQEAEICRYCERTRPKLRAVTDEEEKTGPCIAIY